MSIGTRWILLTALSFCLVGGITGCASIRQAVIDLSIEDQKNVEMVKTVAGPMPEMWDTQSGLARGILWILADHITPAQLKETTRVLDKMDSLVRAMPGKWDKADYDNAYFVGVRMAASGEQIAKLIQFVVDLVAKYAPLVM